MSQKKIFVFILSLAVVSFVIVRGIRAEGSKGASSVEELQVEGLGDRFGIEPRP
jgi:hypothetical protein